jgi:hypothetical protein
MTTMTEPGGSPFADAGRCVEGHPLPPFRLVTFLGADGKPVQAWVSECGADMIKASRRGVRYVGRCGCRVYQDLNAEAVPRERAAP